MATVTIHYGNWVMLPERLLHVLGVTTGGRLTVELEGERIVLQVVTRAEPTEAEPLATAVEASAEATRQAPASEQAQPPPVDTIADRPKRARGQRKGAPTSE